MDEREREGRKKKRKAANEGEDQIQTETALSLTFTACVSGIKSVSGGTGRRRKAPWPKCNTAALTEGTHPKSRSKS